jgi:asparagine synthase (glutamine-hydrolysing)
LNKFNLAALARARHLDLYSLQRPWTDGFAMRLWMMNFSDEGEMNKGTLAGWGVDWRDPLADQRLVEFCLGVPTEEFLADGVPRALAKRAFSDRLPQTVLTEARIGYQAADWHEGLTAARIDVAAELHRSSECALAVKALDVDKMKRLVADWPSSDWESRRIISRYRLALLRGISAGHFLRKASGTN